MSVLLIVQHMPKRVYVDFSQESLHAQAHVFTAAYAAHSYYEFHTSGHFAVDTLNLLKFA